MYRDDSGIVGVNATLAVSCILLVPAAVLAAYTLRAPKAKHVRAAWYAAAVSALALVGVHIAGIATALRARAAGPASDYAFYSYTLPDPKSYTALYTALSFFNGLHSLAFVVALSAVFWEVSRADKAFAGHRTARWAVLGFDVFLGLAVLATWLANVFAGAPCCSGSRQTAVALIISGVFSDMLSLGYPWLILGSYITAAVGAFLLRRWSRQHGLNIPIATATWRLIAPNLLALGLFFVVYSIVYLNGTQIQSDFLVFWVGVPWRIEQVVALGFLVTTLRRAPLEAEHALIPEHKMSLDAEHVSIPEHKKVFDDDTA